jgi:hypothetical protein
MPFLHDESNIEYPDDDTELPPPRADQFVYMTAAEYLGQPATGNFSIQPPPPLPVLSMLDRVRGFIGLSGSPRDQNQWLEESMRKQLEHEQRSRQLLFSITVPALRDLGARRVYCRVDGGNDEGFSWLDQYETREGNRLDVEALATQLHEKGFYDKLEGAGFKHHTRASTDASKKSALKDVIVARLVNEWAWVLLGSFGGGEYLMYGAFTVDLEECTVTDDPRAVPLVQHITIAS